MFKKYISVIAIILAFSLTNLSFAQNDSSSSTLVNINRASAEQLAEHLDGVGVSRASAIVLHRENYGEFETIDELLMVSGIGETILEANRNRISIE